MLDLGGNGGNKTMSDVKVVKLVSGEEIFATVEVVTDAKEPLIRLCNPMCLARTEKGFTLVKWPRFSSSAAIEVRPKQHVITVGDLEEGEILTVYNTANSNIATPNQALLLP